ncbi:MAG: hypothetical protein WD555_00205 [Fulvivirga sp.]
MLQKIADAFMVILDYLVREGINVKFDKKVVQDIKALNPVIKDKLYF